MTKVRAVLEPFGRRVQILITKDEGEHVYYPTMHDWRLCPPENLVTPQLNLARESAQELMDGLWACGLRPTEGEGSAGALAATKDHLGDMQTIAFGLMSRMLAAERVDLNALQRIWPTGKVEGGA